MVTLIDSKKKTPLSNYCQTPKINESEEEYSKTEESDLRVDENDDGVKKANRYKDNINLLTSVYSNSTKSSLSTPMSKPDQRIIGKVTVKKAIDVQSTLLGLLRSNPNETRPGPTITSEFQEKKQKEVEKNVGTVKMNLRKLF